MTPSGSPNLRIVGWGWRRRSARDRERESQAFNQARRLVLSLDVAAPARPVEIHLGVMMRQEL